MTKNKNSNAELIVQISLIVLFAFALMLGLSGVSFSNSGKSVSTGVGTVSASNVIPSGTPKIYGKELGVNYDDVSKNKPQKTEQTISTLENLDRSISLTGEDKQMYIDIAGQISCEYCCGVGSIIRSDGSAACGCSHSFAMRGLAKYLIKNHGDEFSDKEILSELSKWKILFFPGIHEDKAGILEEQSKEVNPINLASNKYRGIEKGQASGGMVGGC